MLTLEDFWQPKVRPVGARTVIRNGLSLSVRKIGVKRTREGLQIYRQNRKVRK